MNAALHPIINEIIMSTNTKEYTLFFMRNKRHQPQKERCCQPEDCRDGAVPGDSGC